MKHFLLIVSTIFSLLTTSFCQELVPITDSINKFTIGVPVGWQYGVPIDKSANFMAKRQKVDENDIPSEVVRINIFQHKETDLNEEYKNFIKEISKRDGFKILEQQDKLIDNRKYKYLVESHLNAVSKQEMTACILLSNDNGKILMLTMLTKSESFDKYRQLYDRIAESILY